MKIEVGKTYKNKAGYIKTIVRDGVECGDEVFYDQENNRYEISGCYRSFEPELNLVEEFKPPVLHLLKVNSIQHTSYGYHICFDGGFFLWTGEDLEIHEAAYDLTTTLLSEDDIQKFKNVIRNRNKPDSIYVLVTDKASFVAVTEEDKLDYIEEFKNKGVEYTLYKAKKDGAA